MVNTGFRWSGELWRVVGLVASMLLIAAVDLIFPELFLIPFLTIPLIASALLGEPRITVVLAVLAFVLTAIAGVLHDDFSAPNTWLHLTILVVAAASSILFATLLGRWRDRLREREDLFRLLAENASDIVVRVAPDGTLMWISPSVATVLGWEAAPLIGQHPWDLVHPDDRAEAARSLAEAATSTDDPPHLVVRFKRPDGTYTWLSAASRVAGDGNFIVSFRRVDDEVRAQAALEESETRYRMLAENTMDLVFSLDMHAVVQWVSPSVLPLLGYDPVELVGGSGAVLFTPDDLPILLDAATQARAGEPAVCRVRMLAKDGSETWVEATPRGLYDDTDALVGGVIGVRDIDAEVQAREALVHEVAFDALTGLAKRAVALERISEILASRGGQGWALICVGVRGMTAVNQAFTHAAGDEVLTVVAGRLVEEAGAADRVARIAGDEFVVLLTDLVTPTDAANAAERLLDAVRGPVTFGATQVDVTGCAGIALAGEGDAEDLLTDATAAMRQASARGTDRWEFLDGDVLRETRQALAVQSELRDALADGRIVPWFMPVVSLADGRLIGYEALARWMLPDGSSRLPLEFLDVAERTGLVLAVDATILSQTLAAAASLPAHVQLGVNVSAATLSSGTLDDWVGGELQRTGTDPGRLHFEVTETALLQVTDTVQHTMSALAQRGVSWWVDDFGTGFSSISHLRDLPLSGLKLDRSFTGGLSLLDNHATRLAQGLAGLAIGLGLDTIAEGVETQEQAQVLASQGWQMGQGWLYGKAAPLADLIPARMSAGAAAS